jgi:hypothetical protein
VNSSRPSFRVVCSARRSVRFALYRIAQLSAPSVENAQSPSYGGWRDCSENPYDATQCAGIRAIGSHAGDCRINTGHIKGMASENGACRNTGMVCCGSAPDKPEPDEIGAIA